MSKREEIKKFISLYLRQRFTSDEMPDDECDTEAEFIFQYLNSQDVVLKEDRELPEPRDIEPYTDEDEAVAYGHYVAGWRNGLQKAKSAGYGAFVSLIKEELDELV